jgi:uncharacterized protein
VGADIDEGRLDPAISAPDQDGPSGGRTAGTVTRAAVDAASRPSDVGSPSSRLDPRSGTWEEAAFFGPGPWRRFGVLHGPVGEPVAGLVICGPYQAEIQRHYRREVLLARRLAEMGIAAHRFHYAGFGHSDGDPSAVTFDTMRDDALAAADRLVRATGVTTVGFLGTRWGGLVAASAVAVRGGHLVLWEPVVDPARYFEEIFRFLIMYRMKEDPATTMSESTVLDRLRRDGSVDVLGYTVDRALYESAVGAGLDGSVADAADAALLVQIGVGKRLRPEYASLAESWTRGGLDTRTHVIRDKEAWWISGHRWPIHEVHPPTTKLLELTTHWIAERLGSDGAR